MILPSICKDTAPQTIFESFSGGIPIIASNIGGFPDFVKHNENGRLFEPGNPDDLAVQINSVLENRELIMKYRTMIPQLKTMSQNAAELFELYCNYISRRSICLH
jgi:glycosyltransferase involved in cell wall biosynthesis